MTGAVGPLAAHLYEAASTEEIREHEAIRAKYTQGLVAIDTAPALPLDGVPIDPLREPLEPLPLVAGVPFAYAPASVLITAPTGAGKSMLLEAVLQDAGSAGLRVAYISGEVSEAEANARAADIATRRGTPINEELRAELSRVRYLDLAVVIPAARDDPAGWVDGIAERYDVIGMDPLSSVASALGLDFDTSNADYTAYHDLLIKPLLDRGVVVLKPDNIGHGPEARSRAKGASAKQDKADVILSCSRMAHPAGLLVKATKVRSVRAPFARGDRWTFARDTLRVERDHTADQDRGEAGFRPTLLMDRTSRKLEAEPGLTRRAIRDAVKGKNEAVLVALDRLISEGYVEARDGDRWRTHHLLKPFRDQPMVPGPPMVPDGPQGPVGVNGPPVPSVKDRGPGTTPATTSEEAGIGTLTARHEEAA